MEITNYNDTRSSDMKMYFMFLFMTTFCELNLPVGGNLIRYIHIVILISAFISNINKGKNIKSFFMLFVFCIFLNCTSSLYYRGQGYLTSIAAYYQLWYLFFFYYLLSIKPGIKTTENTLQNILKTVICVYFLQLLIFPLIIWGNAGAEWVAENDLYFRGLVVGGESAISLGYLFYLNKFIVNKNKQNAFLMIVCAIPFFIRGYRIMIFGAIISTILLLIKTQNRKQYVYLFAKMCFFCIALVILISLLYNYVPIIQSSLDSLIYRAGESNQTFDNDEYIRMISINYYYSEFFKSPLELFFGAGMIGNFGPIFDLFEGLMEYNYNLTDWGLIGLSWYAGIPVVICIIYYLLKGIIEKVPKEYVYINCWFLYLLIISITDPEIYQHYSFLLQSILLYMLYSINPNFLKFSIIKK